MCRNNPKTSPKTIWLLKLHELHELYTCSTYVVLLDPRVGTDYNVLFLLSSLLPTNVLRTQHHVMGSLVEVTTTHPHQNNVLGPPLLLMPEETTLLVEEGQNNHSLCYNARVYQSH